MILDLLWAERFPNFFKRVEQLSFCRPITPPSPQSVTTDLFPLLIEGEITEAFRFLHCNPQTDVMVLSPLSNYRKLFSLFFPDWVQLHFTCLSFFMLFIPLFMAFSPTLAWDFFSESPSPPLARPEHPDFHSLGIKHQFGCSH